MGQQTNKNPNEQQEFIKSWLGNGSINIFGLPYAGKDTQCERLANWLDAPLISGGDLLRSASGLDMTMRAEEESGVLVDRDRFIAFIAPKLKKSEFRDRPLILSSIGRWHGEEEPIMEALAAANHETKCVIYIDISEDIVHKRFYFARNDASRVARTDHDAEILKTRLQEFASKTRPVVDYYRDNGLLLTIDGSGTEEEVEALIINGLYQCALGESEPAA